MSHSVRLLSSQQMKNLDVEYISDGMFSYITTAIDRYLRLDKLGIVDVGGGSGSYADRLLDSYAKSLVTVVEPDKYLLNKNNRHKRKILYQGLYQDCQLLPESYDAVEFNWVLHHFISDSYEKTVEMQKDGIKSAYLQLRKDGLLLIFENFYDGWLLSDIPCRLIYGLTASKRLEKIIRSLGANTAGVGVCFHSERKWIHMIKEQGFTIIDCHHLYDFGNLSWIKKKLLGIKRQHVGLIVAKK